MARIRFVLLASAAAAFAVGSMAALPAAALAQVVIDDFSTAQAVVTDPPGGGSSAVTGGADIIGQSRNLSVVLVSGAGPVSAGVSAGGLDFQVTDTTPDSRGEVLVVWDGNDHTSFDPTGLGGADLTAGGTTGGLRFDIAQAPAGASLVLTIFEDASTVSRAGRVLPQIAAPASLFIDWSELVAAPGAAGPADLSNVGAITLRLISDETPVLRITHIEAVGPHVQASMVDRSADGGPIPPAGVQPGDQIRYRATLANPGAGAEGVDFTVILDPNVALVAGSVRSTPLGRRDQYSTPSEVVLDSAAGALPTLLSNDVDPDGDSLSAVAVVGQATAQGGSVDIGADGSFVYTPPAGFQGVDTFVYTLAATPGDPTVDAAGGSIGAISGRAYVVIDPPLCGNGVQDVLPQAQAACPFLIYGATAPGPTDPSVLFALDPATGVGTLIGTITTGVVNDVRRISSLDFDPNGVLHGVGSIGNQWVLVTIDCNTAAASVIGLLGLSAAQGSAVTDISFDAQGRLWAYFNAAATDEVGTLNPITGGYSSVGASGLAEVGNGMAFAPFLGSSLYHAGASSLSVLNQITGGAGALTPLTFPDGTGNPRINAMDTDFSTSSTYVSVNDTAPGGGSSPENFLGVVDRSSGEVQFLTAPPLNAPDSLDAVAVNRVYETCDPGAPIPTPGSTCSPDSCRLVEANCQDATDNDFDGLIDCDDQDCAAFCAP